jgi:threonine dehydrogenase-like Zn-dependent dehydrogenase
MRALWLEDRRLRLREDVPEPVPAPGEVIVRVLAAGICNTDIEMTRGYYPFTGVPGHEFVGVTEGGKRVVGEINAVCHTCDACRAGRPTHCDHRTVLGIIGRNGAMAESLSLPEENLHVVPDELSTERALFTEPLAAALEIQEQIEVSRDARVLVVGDGKLAQLVARTLALTGCAVSVTGRHRQKLELLEAVGIPTVPAEGIEPRGFDIAVECSGAPSGFALARRALRPRGTLVMKSTYAGELTFNASSLVVDELTLIGSRCGPFAPALRLLASGEIDPLPLIHGTYPLTNGLAAFEHARRPGVLKVIVAMDA